MRYLALLIVIFTLLFTMRSCADKDRQIRGLQRQIKDSQEEFPIQMQAECERSVYYTCLGHADCAVQSIEEIQARVCRWREEQ